MRRLPKTRTERTEDVFGNVRLTVSLDGQCAGCTLAYGCTKRDEAQVLAELRRSLKERVVGYKYGKVG